MRQQHRLDRVETSLTPTQAMVLWLEEAMAHGSLQGYVHWLKEQPASAYPLMRLPAQVRKAVQDAHKGHPRPQLTRAID